MRAEIIARLVLGEREPEAGHVPALRVHGARVTGKPDLSGCDVPYALTMTGCTFDHEPRLEAASTKLIDLTGSRLPCVLLRDARIDGLLRLADCRSTHSVRLTRTHVTGTVDLTGLHVSGAPALHADSLVVERDLRCRDADINGELLMWSARIGGTLVLEGARIVNPEGATFNGDGIVVDGGLFGSARLPGHTLVSQGVLRLEDARISRCCVLSGAQLNNPPVRRCAPSGSMWMARWPSTQPQSKARSKFQGVPSRAPCNSRAHDSTVPASAPSTPHSQESAATWSAPQAYRRADKSLWTAPTSRACWT
ncbi:hypothetical protein [Streptomyces mirabilis]|uniref:hypothetical protein n=1 Tax=Streptomyces mirabilis TaxID=68239 RepID=UPI0022518968|nr:hypothetical protein [Streptomyces mirabilis]MCX4428774.1 hypothetical protein [Streptomyces mirabilis]